LKWQKRFVQSVTAQENVPPVTATAADLAMSARPVEIQRNALAAKAKELSTAKFWAATTISHRRICDELTIRQRRIANASIQIT
jgi:hypothetical protein